MPPVYGGAAVSDDEKRAELARHAEEFEQSKAATEAARARLKRLTDRHPVRSWLMGLRRRPW